MGPIPFDAIDRYAARYNIEGEDFEVFDELIRGMDRVYLRVRNEAKATT